MHDVLIIGGGAAGMTAAIYSCRKGFKTAIISPEWGGLTSTTSHIENYPGFINSTGWDLMSKFKEQAEHFGAESITGKVKKIVKNAEKDFTVTLEDGTEMKCRAVIMAHGKVPRRLDIPGYDEFMGKGLSTCATCDAPLYRGKRVAVIGGGNSALEAVEELRQVGAEMVYLVHRRDSFRADEITVEKVKKLDKVEFILNAVPAAITGEKFVETFVVKDVNSGEERTLEVDGVFSEIGYVADSSMVEGLTDLNESGEVIVDENKNTSVPGIFAAGDITPVRYKQTVIAAGAGAVAALEAHRYLTGVVQTEYAK
jgi:alkyl hydroperoxide reductase subunit F